MAAKKFSRSGRGRQEDLPEYFVRDPRTGKLLIRIRVPAECRPHLPAPHRGRDENGKGELLYFLGTSDLTVAKQRERHEQVIYRFKAIIAAARPKPTKWAYLPPTAAEIERMREIIGIFMQADPNDFDEHGKKILATLKAQTRHILPAARFEMVPVDNSKDDNGKEIIRFEPGVDYWADQRKVVGPSRDQYKSRFNEFAKLIGHDIMNRVTTDDLIRYKDKQVAEGRQLKTVKNYVGNLRTVLQALIDDRKIDPIDLRVKVLLKANPRTRRKQFENPDRYLIYTAAMATQDPLYRYGSLLPLFSGMRISEWSEADTRDVRRLDGVWVLCLDYDNKLLDDVTLKNDESVRKVPIHSVVLSAGFLKYVRSLPPGPLFPMLRPDPKYGRRRQEASRLMGSWLRHMANIKDPKKVNHSHRHSAETLMLVNKVDKRIAYFITGHAPADTGERYLHPPIPTLREGVEAIPIPTKPTEAVSVYDYAEDDDALVA
jgi:integrase